MNGWFSRKKKPGKSSLQKKVYKALNVKEGVVEFMKYCYYKLDTFQWSCGVLKPILRAQTREWEMVRKKREWLKRLFQRIFPGGEQTKGATAIGKHKVIIRFFKMGNIKKQQSDLEKMHKRNSIT